MSEEMPTQEVDTPAATGSQAELPQYWIYILKCRDNSLYTGIARDAEKRLQAHNRGTGAKYTRSRRPCEIVYQELVFGRSRAQKREREIKKLSREAKLQLIEAGQTGPNSRK